MEIYLSVNDFPDSISQLPKRKEENIIYEVVCVKLFNILTRRSIFRSLTPFRNSAGFRIRHRIYCVKYHPVCSDDTHGPRGIT
jgi:hypothetical protein